MNAKHFTEDWKTAACGSRAVRLYLGGALETDCGRCQRTTAYKAAQAAHKAAQTPRAPAAQGLAVGDRVFVYGLWAVVVATHDDSVDVRWDAPEHADHGKLGRGVRRTHILTGHAARKGERA